LAAKNELEELNKKLEGAYQLK